PCSRTWRIISKYCFMNSYLLNVYRRALSTWPPLRAWKAPCCDGDSPRSSITHPPQPWARIAAVPWSASQRPDIPDAHLARARTPLESGNCRIPPKTNLTRPSSDGAGTTTTTAGRTKPPLPEQTDRAGKGVDRLLPRPETAYPRAGRWPAPSSRH